MKLKLQGTARAAARSALLGALVACHREPAAQPSEHAERSALVAQACPEIAPGPEAVNANNARVFVEVVELTRRDLPDPVGDWLREHPVTIRSSSNLVAFPNVPTSMPWGQCVDTVCKGTQQTLTLTAQLPAHGTDPIEIAVQIAGATPAGGAKPLLDTTLRATSQQPVVLPVSPELSPGSVVVTAYLLRQLDDLHRLLECKARQAERANQLGD